MRTSKSIRLKVIRNSMSMGVIKEAGIFLAKIVGMNQCLIEMDVTSMATISMVWNATDD